MHSHTWWHSASTHKYTHTLFWEETQEFTIGMLSHSDFLSGGPESPKSRKDLSDVV